MGPLPKFQQIKVDLQQQLEYIQNELVGLSEEQLHAKGSETTWSILECIGHLNRYATYYNKELKRAISSLEGTAIPEKIELSWLGKKSVDAIRVQNTKKQKTPKRMNPVAAQLSVQVLNNFIQHQKELIALLAKASTINYNRKKVRIEFFKLLKLSVYDTYLFMLEHQNRHLQQADIQKNNWKNIVAS